MMFITNNKTTVMIIIAALLVFSITTIKVFAEQTSSADESLDSYIKIQKQGIELEKAIGENSITPQLFIKTNSMLIDGTTEVEARKEAAKQLIEDMALQEYAKKNGLSVSEEELDRFIDDMIQTAHEDSDFSEIQAACIEQGVTFEDTIYSVC